MSGVSEILVIVAIILGIVMLPRLMNRPHERDVPRRAGGSRISGWMRLALVASLVWPALVAIYMEPWNGRWPVFVTMAAAPPALAWGVFWVVSGFKNKKK